MKRRLATRILAGTLMLLPLTAFADPGTSNRSMQTGPSGQQVPLDPALAEGIRQIDAKNWTAAIDSLAVAVKRDPGNADIFNLVGYAYRNLGKLDEAFRLYERALALDPQHRGAHEYVGEAYLMAGNLQKAEEHLAVLDKLCLFPCEEFTDLKKKIAEYRQRKGK
jgi:Flp pilus assembly protein TadD